MFTGIIESTGTVTDILTTGTNRNFTIASPISRELRIDQSVSHNGVCLTVEWANETHHRLTAIEETLRKTNLSHWEIGTVVNLERCLTPTGRLDGHLVQGHVDGTAICREVRTLEGSWEYRFEFDKSFAHLLIEKGSIALNGISLTLFDVSRNQFSVAIIPYTYEHTNMKLLREGDVVNVEFDLIGKYVARSIQLRS